MDFTDSVSSFFRNYAVFEGRSSRSEYWFPQLFNFMISFAFGLLDAAISGGQDGLGSGLNLIYSLAIIVPNLAVTARRLHDTGKSGWWYLLILTVVGIIPVIYWLCKGSDVGENDYGPNAKPA